MVLRLRTKGDLITEAFRKMKISGITAPPDAEDTQLMVERLEGVAYEFQERGLDLEYNFTMDPDPADFHGMEYYAFQPISSILAYRSVQDFGMEAPQTLFAQARAGNDLLSARVGNNKLRQVLYPSRHPRGSGNTQRYIRWRTYYPETEIIPLDDARFDVRAGATNDFTEDFSNDFNAGETIMFLGVEFTDGLSYVELSRTLTRVTYRIGTSLTTNRQLEAIRWTVTTSSNRVILRDRFIDVELTEDLEP